MLPTYLVRHVMTGHNAPSEAQGKVRAGTDVPISLQGRADLTRLARWFKGKPVQRVLTSGTRRAGETAKAIADATGAPLVVHPGFEPWQGAAPNQDMQTAAPLLKHLFAHPNEVGPGKQSYRQFYERWLQALHEMRYGDVGVTHGRNVMTAWSLMRGGGQFHPSLPPHDPAPTHPGDVFQVTPKDLVKVFSMPPSGRKDTGS